MIEIVADGGPATGFGHVGRCLAVWESLGGSATFASDEPSVIAFLDTYGASAHGTPDPAVTVLDRAQPTPRSTVLDLQRAGRRVVLIDDPGTGRELADLVIDAPTAAGNLATGSGQHLSGFRHALLRREVLEADRAAVPSGVLIAIGGSDPTGRTPEIARSLDAAGVTDLSVNLGPGYSGGAPGVGKVLKSPADFIDWLARTRLLVSAWGHVVIEAAHLGIPVVVAITQPEHRGDAMAFASHGTLECIDISGERPVEPLARRVAGILADEGRLSDLAAHGRALIDGMGAQRVAAAIAALAETA